jgi:hypothetical protein
MMENLLANLTITKDDVVYNFRFDHTIPPTQIKRFNTILKIIRKRNTKTKLKKYKTK